MSSPFWPGAPDVPQLPFRRLFAKLNRPVPGDAEIVTAYTDGQVTLRSNRAKIGYHEAADLSGFQGVEVGDFVVHGLDIMRGSIGVSESAGAISSVCTVCKPIGPVDPQYAAYAIRLQAASGYPKALARGVREGGADFRRWDTLAELPIPVPPIETQRAVVSFLDRETAEIDAFIADQEELIRLLTERRAATISHAVTKGLDPTVPLRDSGTALLGNIPAHWLLGPVRRFLHSRDSSRVPLSSEERSYRQGVYPYYGASGIIDYVDDFIFDEKLVLVSEDGANLVLRSKPVAFVADGKYWVNNHAHILEPSNGAVDYWAYRIESSEISPWVTGAAQPKLTIEALMGIVVTCPPDPAECRAIEAFLAEECSQLDAAIADAREAITLSRERRAALISAAVTGKIDVREHAHK